MSQDNGNWLSAEQAVMPDGSERHDLPLINRKLPQLSKPSTPQQPASPPPAPSCGACSPCACERHQAPPADPAASA